MDLGTLSVSPRVNIILGNTADGVYDKFGIPMVVGMSATRVVVAVPWRTASYASYSFLRLILLDRDGAQITITDLPWIQSEDETEVALVRLDDTHLIEVTYVGSVSTVTGVTARWITVADSGFTVADTVTSPASLEVTGLALAADLGLVVAFGWFGAQGEGAGFLALDIATGAVLWTGVETLDFGQYRELFVDSAGTMTAYYIVPDDTQSSHVRSWALTRSSATPITAGALEPFSASQLGSHINPAYTSGASSAARFDWSNSTIDCYSSSSPTPSAPITTTTELVPFSRTYASEAYLNFKPTCSPANVAIDLLFNELSEWSLAAHTAAGAVSQAAIPDGGEVFGFNRYACGDAGLGAFTAIDSEPIPGTSFYSRLVRVWMFTVELLLVTTPPPLRQIQRDDGLGRSVMRARGGSSAQRSIRQRGYR